MVDPDDTGRYLQIRGDAELVEVGALEYLDQITGKYTQLQPNQQPSTAGARQTSR